MVYTFVNSFFVCTKNMINVYSFIKNCKIETHSNSLWLVVLEIEVTNNTHKSNDRWRLIRQISDSR